MDEATPLMRRVKMRVFFSGGHTDVEEFPPCSVQRNVYRVHTRMVGADRVAILLRGDGMV